MIRANDEGRERVAAFLTRFHDFDDAVVREVRLSVGGSGETAAVSLEARDFDTNGLDWVKLRLTVAGVTEYRLTRNGREYPYVISSGLKVDRFGDLTFFDFGPYTDEPEGVEDFRRSSFYLAGRSFEWKVLPYPRSWGAKRPQDSGTGGVMETIHTRGGR